MDHSTGPDRFIRIRAVALRIGLSIPTVYRLTARGEFPRQVRVGRAAVWSEREVDDWINARLADRAA